MICAICGKGPLQGNEREYGLCVSCSSGDVLEEERDTERGLRGRPEGTMSQPTVCQCCGHKIETPATNNPNMCQPCQDFAERSERRCAERMENWRENYEPGSLIWDNMR